MYGDFAHLVALQHALQQLYLDRLSQDLLPDPPPLEAVVEDLRQPPVALRRQVDAVVAEEPGELVAGQRRELGLGVAEVGALGGGCELALASDYILLSDRDDVRIGLPEIKLGILPAWGGCSRLPRRVGLAAAFIGGLVNYYDGHLHPLNLCTGEARAAASLGASIFEQSPVVNIVSRILWCSFVN